MWCVCVVWTLLLSKIMGCLQHQSCPSPVRRRRRGRQPVLLLLLFRQRDGAQFGHTGAPLEGRASRVNRLGVMPCRRKLRSRCQGVRKGVCTTSMCSSARHSPLDWRTRRTGMRLSRKRRGLGRKKKGVDPRTDQRCAIPQICMRGVQPCSLWVSSRCSLPVLASRGRRGWLVSVTRGEPQIHHVADPGATVLARTTSVSWQARTGRRYNSQRALLVCQLSQRKFLHCAPRARRRVSERPEEVMQARVGAGHTWSQQRKA